MEHVKYNSIRNGYDAVFLDRCAQACGDSRMVALEKIHGANFSFLTDGDTVAQGSRNDLIDPTESFYGSGRFFNRYAPTVKTLFQLVKSEFPRLTKLVLFGEIFGGRYNGETVPGAKQVQGGMNYHPDTEFAAFDIKLFFENGVETYIPYVDMVDLLDDANMLTGESNRIKTAPVVAIGTIKELVTVNPLFYTKVPAWFGLNTCDEKTDVDYAEGFVIRGYDEDFRTHRNDRVVIKVKNERFAESDKPVRIKSEIVLDEDEQAKLDGICSYINTNRLNNVLSKVEVTSAKQFGMVQGNLVRDALEDFQLDTGVNLSGDPVWSKIAKMVGKHAADTIKPVWVTLINQ